MDRELLKLATYNTNLHAADITRGEATHQLQDFDEAVRAYAAQVRKSLEPLAPLAVPPAQENLRRAQAAFLALMKTHAEITRLSRMNNSIRSMELSLGRKRGVAALCDDDLAALRALVQSQSFKATR